MINYCHINRQKVNNQVSPILTPAIAILGRMLDECCRNKKSTVDIWALTFCEPEFAFDFELKKVDVIESTVSDRAALLQRILLQSTKTTRAAIFIRLLRKVFLFQMYPIRRTKF